METAIGSNQDCFGCGTALIRIAWGAGLFLSMYGTV